MRYCLFLILFPAAVVLAEAKSADTTRVVHAYTGYVLALSSDNEETRIAAVQEAAPTQHEVGRIWKDERKAALAWKMIKAWSNKMIANNKNVYAETAGAGGLVGVTLSDYRKTEEDVVTRIVPEAIPLFIISAEHERGSATIHAMIIDGRIMLVDHLTQICRALEAIDPGAGEADTAPNRPVKAPREVDRTNPQAVAEAFWKAMVAEQWEEAARFVHEEDREWFVDNIEEGEVEELPSPPKHPVIEVKTDGSLGRTTVPNWLGLEGGLDMTREDGLWWIGN